MFGVNRNKERAFIIAALAWVFCLATPPAAPAEWQQQTRLFSSDGATLDWFGFSVSISSDYAIVGAGWDDDLGKDSGSAYIFKRRGTSWQQQAKLLASDCAADDHFGRSVSISGKYAIVGALHDDDRGINSGSAYIFTADTDANNWLQQAKLTATDSAANDLFGISVSISGDYAIVGACCHQGNRGSAYIFKRAGDKWSEQAKLTASDGSTGDLFGWSVSICPDYAIVGAYGKDNWTGSAYIFKRDGATWTQQAKLTASDAATGSHFGRSVFINADYAIIGSPCDDDRGEHSGSAYIFKRSGTNWAQQAKLIAADGARGDYFGWSVSITPDYCLVGAFWDDDKAHNSGSAYFFKHNAGAWTPQLKLHSSDGTDDHDRFGCSVCISRQYAIVGAPRGENGPTETGLAYIFNLTNLQAQTHAPSADTPVSHQNPARLTPR